MKKIITTIYLEPALKEYARINNLNISQFINDALTEHSGVKKDTQLSDAKAKAKEMSIALAIQEAIVKDLEEKEAKALLEQEKQREEAEKAQELAKTHCVKCGNGIAPIRVEMWGSLCENCFKMDFKGGK